MLSHFSRLSGSYSEKIYASGCVNRQHSATFRSAYRLFVSRSAWSRSRWAEPCCAGHPGSGAKGCKWSSLSQRRRVPYHRCDSTAGDGLYNNIDVAAIITIPADFTRRVDAHRTRPSMSPSTISILTLPMISVAPFPMRLRNFTTRRATKALLRLLWMNMICGSAMCSYSSIV